MYFDGRVFVAQGQCEKPRVYLPGQALLNPADYAARSLRGLCFRVEKTHNEKPAEAVRRRVPGRNVTPIPPVLALGELHQPDDTRSVSLYPGVFAGSATTPAHLELTDRSFVPMYPVTGDTLQTSSCSYSLLNRTD